MSVPPSSAPTSTTTTTGTISTTIGKETPQMKSETNPTLTSIPSNQSTELQFHTEPPTPTQGPAKTEDGAPQKETVEVNQIVPNKQVNRELKVQGSSNLNNLPITATTVTTVLCRSEEQASGSVNQQHDDKVHHHYSSNGSDHQNDRDENDNQEVLSNEEQPSVAASEPSVEENSAGLGDMRDVSESKDAGRKKIKIELIRDPRSRQVTFLKRKNGLMKKAMELVSYLVFPSLIPNSLSFFLACEETKTNK